MNQSHDVTALLSAADVICTGEGPPLALAHGAGGGVELNFAQVIDRLKGKRSLVGVNYPGSGGTPMDAGPLEIDVLADTVVAAMIDAGHERFPILGLSLGTTVAVSAAVRHPDRVTGLVLTSGFASSDAQIAGVVDVWTRLAALEEWDALAQLLVNTASPATLSAISDEQRLAAVAEVRRTYPVGGAEQASLAGRADTTSYLADVSVPTLVIVAGQDRIVLPSTTSELAAGIPGSERLVYADAGHIFTPPEVDRWIDDLSDFLSRHDL